MSCVTITFGEVRLKSKYDLFVCFRIIVPLKNFSLIWRRHHYRWRTASFDLFSVLMTIEQWGFFRMPHLLWHGASVYNGHLTPFAERLAVELSIPVLRLKSIAAWIRIPNLSLAGPTLYSTAPSPIQMWSPVLIMVTSPGFLLSIYNKMFYRVTYMHE